MSNLPEWIKQFEKEPPMPMTMHYSDARRFIKALAIAWENLESTGGFDCENIHYKADGSCGYCFSCDARTAMLRIEEIGK